MPHTPTPRNAPGATLALACLLAALAPVAAPGQTASIAFTASRFHPATGAGASVMMETGYTWDSARTALLLGDLRDRHWCTAATERLDALVPKMRELVDILRGRGVFVIHAPGDTMAFYEGSPARRRAREAPHTAAPVRFDRWVVAEPPEPPCPVPEYDVDCDCEPRCIRRRAWTRGHPGIEVRDEDAVTDQGQEVWNLVQARGIRHVIYLGVHANLEALGRPYGLRTLARLGLDVVFVSDLTDAQFAPRRPPGIPVGILDSGPVRLLSPFDRTPEAVAHIERYCCPVAWSEILRLESPPHVYRLCNLDTPTPVALFACANTDRLTGAALSGVALETARLFDWRSRVLLSECPNRIGGLEILAANRILRLVDLLVLTGGGTTLSSADLEPLRNYFDRGGPLVALGASSRTFASWRSFDCDVLGARFVDSAGTPDGISIQRRGESPLLSGVELPFASAGPIDRFRDLDPACELLLAARDAAGEDLPVAWTRTAGGRRVFFTSLGRPRDFENPSFRRLLLNALEWAMGPEPDKRRRR